MPFEKPRIFSPNKHAKSARSGSNHGATIFVTGKPDLNESSSAIRPRNAGFGLGTEPSIRGETSQSCDDDLGLPAELQMLAANMRGEADAFDQRYAQAGAPAAIRRSAFSTAMDLAKRGGGSHRNWNVGVANRANRRAAATDRGYTERCS